MGDEHCKQRKNKKFVDTQFEILNSMHKFEDIEVDWSIQLKLFLRDLVSE
jgi:hypothetical protein